MMDESVVLVESVLGTGHFFRVGRRGLSGRDGGSSCGEKRLRGESGAEGGQGEQVGFFWSGQFWSFRGRRGRGHGTKSAWAG